MKIKKQRLKELVAKCDEVADLVMLEVDPAELRSLIKEVRKHRKRRRRQRELREQCDELREYVNSGDATEDGVSKRYDSIGDLAVTTFLGPEFVAKLNELL